MFNSWSIVIYSNQYSDTYSNLQPPISYESSLIMKSRSLINIALRYAHLFNALLFIKHVLIKNRQLSFPWVVFSWTVKDANSLYLSTGNTAPMQILHSKTFHEIQKQIIQNHWRIILLIAISKSLLNISIIIVEIAVHKRLGN